MPPARQVLEVDWSRLASVARTEREFFGHLIPQ
jgi:hypothetical protein